MSRHSTIVLALLALALVLIISFGEEVRKDSKESSRRSRVPPNSGNSESGSSNAGPRKSSQSESALQSLRDMLPPGATVVQGDLSQSASQSPVAVVFDGVRIEAAGARSYRNGVLVEAPYRMIGLTEAKRKNWASESESGYVYLERNGEKMVWEAIEPAVLEQDEPPQNRHAKPLP
jgi:hypothetical protein